MRLRRSGLVWVLLGGLWSVPARAADTWGHRTTSSVAPEVTPDHYSGGNGVYGRFKGDLQLGLGLGAEFDRSGARGAARLTLHYFSMLGVYSSYRDGFGRGGDGAARLLSVGVDLRPGFVPRWAKGQQTGQALPDLLIDSVSLGLGAFWAEPAGHGFGSERGFETSLGFGIPLMLRADGLWLEARGQLRWPERAGAPEHSAVPSAFALLSWHGFVVTPLAASQRTQ